jgi:DNA-directed RNA polymerase specialized sigma subunit
MSPMAAKAMRELYFVGRLKQHEIGKMFGLRQGSVSRVISEQVWA